jgi:26S proteasome regulatory subunit N10
MVGSPLTDDSSSFQKIGKQLKKNNIAIDVIALGSTEENFQNLSELVKIANSNDNRYFVVLCVC